MSTKVYNVMEWERSSMSTKVYNVTRTWSGSVPQCPRRYIMSPGHGVGAFLNVHEGI